MATVTECGNPSNTFSIEPLEMWEFTPIVSLDAEPIDYDDVKETSLVYKKDEKVTLSDKISKSIRDKYTLMVFTTESKKLSLKFTVKNGTTDQFYDDDGYIKPEIALAKGEKELTEKESIKITDDKSFLVDYTKKKSTLIEFDVEINTETEKTFFINFYANDNKKYFDIEGKYKNVFCGQVKVIKKKSSICKDKDWSFFPSLVSDSKKVTYGSSLSWTNTPECYHYALQQLKDLGYWVKTERWNKKWDGTKELNDDIFQLYLSSDVAGMKKGIQKEMFENSLIYLKQAMESKTPVMVGLHYREGYANEDLTTDHFAVITGCGRDIDGKLYFEVTDNFYSSGKYYCICENYEIIKGNYIISQVRKSRKL
ncbi:hypothetical protein [Tenacibaculum sp. SDUM215027]|uniref:hypothetical protein n=1 Tax=Tenacibaculum sp. SDUM215027 TaxID=3422596 RepID=UPI003D319BC8